ncbi:hypothetical protein PFICI_02869 [Pestalotiopsis fici W106-1]|uniref:Pyridoxamine 5'-phosphate oxidase N-terminal domain-containing protein n=1 Tax=Pestalotiopsis fici (strain W106-1 / CGMCC3.15140) TaxID=1229662 RepID=W3XFR1_PESFW|nr:uncharacterized protein PFICI_02869 [Pestalotiopsis fici W106-1]ETS84844.1 hypothetical protein PFICI_02869 [Pestalotiopsis fici W106-1]
MGAYYEVIPKSLFKWILEQKMFWVATAPLSAAGHVNVSPKGGACFGLIDEKTFYYMDMTGSGNETISHLYENGRVTILFNAFEGPPRILRLFGRGRVLERGTAEYADFVKKNTVGTHSGTRTIILVDVHQVGTSCGFSVPFYDFKAFRPVLDEYFEKKEKRYLNGKEEESMPRYWALKNAWSVDGLPGMKVGQETMRKEGIVPLKKMVGNSSLENSRRPVNGFSVAHLVLAIVLSALLSAFLTLHGADVALNIKQRLPARQ